MEHRLEVMPEDWQRILAVVAHPDDLEYGAASAVARWTSAGKWVGTQMTTPAQQDLHDVRRGSGPALDPMMATPQHR